MCVKRASFAYHVAAEGRFDLRPSSVFVYWNTERLHDGPYLRDGLALCVLVNPLVEVCVGLPPLLFEILHIAF